MTGADWAVIVAALVGSQSLSTLIGVALQKNNKILPNIF